MKIDALTGLRFFAAFAIVLTHSQLPTMLGPGHFDGIMLQGAVPLFFVLSGFVLALNAPRYRSVSDFYVARWARVWPAHAAATAFMFIAFMPYSPSLLVGAENQFRLLLNLALLQAWSPDIANYYSLNTPSWSVSVEMFFYAAFPLVVAAFTQRPLLKGALMIPAAMVAVVLAGRAFPQVDTNWLSYINPLVNLPTFAIGVALGLSTARPNWNGPAAQIAAVALVLVANPACVAIARLLPVPLSSYVAVTAAAPAYAFLIFALARYDGPVSRFLSTKPLVFLGEVSFSLYLFHQIVFRWHGAEGWTFPMWAQVAVVWALALGVSIACHLLVERPARRWITQGWTALRRPTFA